MSHTISINRAPVLTLWGAVVAERMGYDPKAALTIGRALAGLNAQTKGRLLGIFGKAKGPHQGPPQKKGLGEDFWIEVCGRSVPAKKTGDGVRAVVLDKPIDPADVRKYLAGKFGDDLTAVRKAMTELAESYDKDELCETAYELYEKFRPTIPRGKSGWGQKGELDLDLVRSLAPAGK